MPIDNILMSFLHDIFKISALFYYILFYDFLSEITNVSFMPISSFRGACWWKIIFLFGTLKTVVIYVAQMILWQEITTLEKTSLGWLIIHSLGKSYLSDETLSAPTQAYLVQQQLAIQSEITAK